MRLSENKTHVVLLLAAAVLFGSCLACSLLQPSAASQLHNPPATLALPVNHSNTVSDASHTIQGSNVLQRGTNAHAHVLCSLERT